MKMAAVTSIDDYLNLYYGQLSSIGLPEDLYGRLYDKLFPEIVYDAGDAFVLHEKGSGSQGFSLVAKKPLPENSDVFIVDHAWSNDGSSVARKQLEKMPQLISRLQSMFGLQEFDTHNNEESSEEYFIDSEEIVSETCGCSLDKARLALKEYDGSLIEAIMQINFGSQPQKSKEIDTPQCSFEEFKLITKSLYPEESSQDVSDEYMRKMYESFLLSKGKSVGAAITSKYSWTDNVDDGFIEVNVAIKMRTRKENIKSELLPKHWHLEIDGMGILIDGDLHESIIVSESWWTIESHGVLTIYLKKGATHGQLWTELIRGEVQLSPSDIEEARWKSELKGTVETKDILDEMWIYNQTYCISSASSYKSPCPTPVWYIMDEVGSAINHKSTPNFACHPLFVLSKGIAISIIWPMRDVDAGEVITRNFIQPIRSGESRPNFAARSRIFEIHDGNVEVDDIVQETRLTKSTDTINVYDIQSVSHNQTFERGLRFFCDFITDEDFEDVTSSLGCIVTSDMKTADIILSKCRFKNLHVSENSKVNRFSGEESLLNKLTLDAIIRERLGEAPWYLNSYNLLEELPEVLNESKRAFFNQRWVLRASEPDQVGIRPVVTSDVLRISRLIESGFTVASKYFLNAAKYNERCFALSYVLYIKSPKEIYLHKMPYIREAKEKHTPLAMLNEYDTASILTDIPDQYNFKSNEKGDFAVFIKALEEISNKYSLGKSWKNVEDNIVESVAALLGAVKSSIVPLIGKNSFGLLGLDFILDNNLRPYFIGLSHIPYFADEVVLKDVISVLLCCDTSKGLPSGTSFFKLTCG